MDRPHSCICSCHMGPDVDCDSLNGCAAAHPRHSPPRWRRGPEQIAGRGQQRCLLDRQPARAGGTLCTDHADEVRLMLDPANGGNRDEQIPASIPAYWGRLDPTPGVTDPRDRRAPGFESSPPLNLHAVALRDPRSRPQPVVPVWWPARPGDGRPDHDKPMWETDGDIRPVRTALAALAAAMWEDLDLQGPRLPGGDVVLGGVERHAAWLLHHLDELTAHPHADDIWRDLAELQDSLRGPAGDPADRAVGTCTGWVRARDGEKVVCGAPLHLPPPRPGVTLPATAPVLRCGRCDRPYSSLMLLRLELAAEAS